MKKLLVVLSVILVLAFAGFAFADHNPGDNPEQAASEATSAAANPSEEAVSYYADASTTVTIDGQAVEVSYAQAEVGTLEASDVKTANEAAAKAGVELTAVAAPVDCTGADIPSIQWVNMSKTILAGYQSDPDSFPTKFYTDKDLNEAPDGTMWFEGLVGTSYVKLTKDNVKNASELIVCFLWDAVDPSFIAADVEAAKGDGVIVPMAAYVKSSGSTPELGGSGGGCTMGTSALAFAVLGLFLACRKK